jgi:hypothetical protein
MAGDARSLRPLKSTLQTDEPTGIHFRILLCLRDFAPGQMTIGEASGNMNDLGSFPTSTRFAWPSRLGQRT